MKHKAPCVLVAAVSAVVLAVGLGGSVQADSPVINTPNGNASGKWQSAPDTWRLCDLSANGKTVYIHAGTTAANAQNGQRRYENFNGGCINTAVYNLAGNPYWRVCENISGGPDSCSAIRVDVR